MEKETTVKIDDFIINFLCEEESCSGIFFKEIKESLNLLAKSFSRFKQDYLPLKKKTFNLNITLCSEERIQELNLLYRKKDKATDVLSFPLQENIRGGEFDAFLEEIELGDMYICESVCSKQAVEFSLSFQEEFRYLSVHGFLHLCGYDHELSDEEEKLMEKLEEIIMSIYLGSF